MSLSNEYYTSQPFWIQVVKHASSQPCVVRAMSGEKYMCIMFKVEAQQRAVFSSSCSASANFAKLFKYCTFYTAASPCERNTAIPLGRPRHGHPKRS
uniref:Uncharacterized protein n=1 Tax=Ixodes ricinus TaxID=34613 RepID=A0A0K8RDI0_IXORI